MFLHYGCKKYVFILYVNLFSGNIISAQKTKIARACKGK